MPTSNIARTLFQSGLFQSGLFLIGGALLFAEAAWLHMRALVQTYGAICGGGFNIAPHCPACFASLLLFASGVTALVLARADRPAVRVRSA